MAIRSGDVVAIASKRGINIGKVFYHSQITHMFYIKTQDRKLYGCSPKYLVDVPENLRVTAESIPVYTLQEEPFKYLKAWKTLDFPFEISQSQKKVLYDHMIILHLKYMNSKHAIHKLSTPGKTV